jgi:hypothetical protein
MKTAADPGCTAADRTHKLKIAGFKLLRAIIEDIPQLVLVIAYLPLQSLVTLNMVMTIDEWDLDRTSITQAVGFDFEAWDLAYQQESGLNQMAAMASGKGLRPGSGSEEEMGAIFGTFWDAGWQMKVTVFFIIFNLLNTPKNLVQAYLMKPN